MKHLLTTRWTLSTLATLLLAGLGDKVEAAERPNIVVIFADDLGYGDISCYNPKGVETPHLDALSTETSVKVLDLTSN